MECGSRKTAYRGGVTIWVRAAGILSLVVTLGLLPVTSASAHQPVVLGPDDTTPRSGPLLPDGTISYAVRTEVAAGQERGFRFGLRKGDRMAVQLLILDRPPANGLAAGALPEVTLIDPRGRRTVLPINERTEFYEPYSKTTYLFLSRVESAAVPGTYRVVVRGRAAQPVDTTVAVGYREVPGRVIE